MCYLFSGELSFFRLFALIDKLCSLAFLLYVLALMLINLYLISGRNKTKNESENINRADGGKWYESVPLGDLSRNPQFVVGED